MVDIVYTPSFPPASPYEGYLYLLVIPFLLRLILVLPPLIDMVQKFSPERKLVMQTIRSLKIKGLWLIITNEVLALFLPFLLALYARILFDPIGWEGWDQTPSNAIYLLIVAGASWVFGDFLRVARTRRLLRSVSERNKLTMKAAAHGVIKARGVLGVIQRLKVPGLGKSESETDSEEVGGVLDKVAGIGTKVGSQALETADAALGVVRDKAGELTQRMDDEVQKGIRQQSKLAIQLLIRDLLMGIAPVVILVGLYHIW